jgi:hypothetical protein
MQGVLHEGHDALPDLGVQGRPCFDDGLQVWWKIANNAMRRALCWIGGRMLPVFLKVVRILPGVVVRGLSCPA